MPDDSNCPLFCRQRPRRRHSPNHLDTGTPNRHRQVGFLDPGNLIETAGTGQRATGTDHANKPPLACSPSCGGLLPEYPCAYSLPRKVIRTGDSAPDFHPSGIPQPYPQFRFGQLVGQCRTPMSRHLHSSHIPTAATSTKTLRTATLGSGTAPVFGSGSDVRT